jgi:hypothetical protein
MADYSQFASASFFRSLRYLFMLPSKPKKKLKLPVPSSKEKGISCIVAKFLLPSAPKVKAP